MTKFDAINEILLSLNELPLDETDLVSDVPIAVIVDKELDVATRSILAKGWNFNTISVSLSVNLTGHIEVSKEYLSVDAGGGIVVRDWKLYDTVNNTFKFDEDVSVTVVENIIFDDLPFSIADYIIKQASLQSYINVIGNSDDISLRYRILDGARIEAIRIDARQINGNLLEKDYATNLLDRYGV